MSLVERGAQIGQQSLQHLLRSLLTVEADNLVAHLVGIDDRIEQGFVLSSLAQKEQSLFTPLDRGPAPLWRLRNTRCRESPASTETSRR